jgi:hypothetical protein
MAEFIFESSVPLHVRADDVFRRLTERLLESSWGSQVHTIEVKEGGTWSIPHKGRTYPFCYYIDFKNAAGAILDPGDLSLCVTPSGPSGELVFRSPHPADFR